MARKMRGWVKPIFSECLSKLEGLTESDTDDLIDLGNWVREQFNLQGKTSLIQHKDLMQEIRDGIKRELGEDHFCLEFLRLSTGEYVKANQATLGRVSRQNSSQVVLSPSTVNAAVTRATKLLLSRDWAEIAAGLALLTGRRSAEIMKTAQFEKKTEYSVVFCGAIKRGNEQSALRFEIPTLCRADDVINALQKLRKAKPTEGMTVDDTNNFSKAIAASCDKNFSDLIEPPQEREKLYTHLFRKIYTAIAVFFYCPATVDESEFRAEIQGHFSHHEDLEMAERRSLTSDRNYRAYAIADEDGNTKKGIRLDWHGVEVLECFRPAVAPEKDIQQQAITESDLGAILAEMAQMKAQLDRIEKQSGDASLKARIAELEAENEQLKTTMERFREIMGLSPSPNAAPKIPVVTPPHLHTDSSNLGGVATEPERVATVEENPVAIAEETPIATVEKTPVEPERVEPRQVAADPDVIRAIELIMSYNDSQPEHSKKWAISFPVMKDLLKQIGKATQPKIYAGFNAMAQQIDEHHSKHSIGSRHNRSHKDEKITDFVTL